MRSSLHNVPAGKTNQEPTLVHRRVEITVEREVVSVVHQTAPNFISLCRECGREVLKLTPESAAAATGTSPREVYRWLDEGNVHFEESESGQVFVCSESLKGFAGGARRLPTEAQ
jgi:hypothetical protein